MDGYYTSTLKLMAGIGINLGFFKVRFLGIIIFVNFSVAFACIVQEIMFFIDKSNLETQRLSVVPCLLTTVEALYKYVTGIYYRKPLKETIERLDKIYEKMDPKDQAKFKMQSFKLRRIGLTFGTATMITIWIFSLFPIIVMMKIYFSSGVFVKVYPFFFWWPFDNEKYFISTFLYQFYLGQVAAVQTLIMDVLYMMILAQIITHFQHLCRDFQGLIEDISESAATDGKIQSRFKYLVQVQEELTEHCETLNKIYGPPCLLHVLLASGNICFTGFLVVTQSDAFVLIQYFSVLTLSLIHTYSLCWFGDKIEEEASLLFKPYYRNLIFFLFLQCQNIATSIYDSRLYEIKSRLQKDMMLVMVKSQNAVNMKATSFFKLDIPGFASVSQTLFSIPLRFHLFSFQIMSSSYSYFTLLQQIYGNK